MATYDITKLTNLGALKRLAQRIKDYYVTQTDLNEVRDSVTETITNAVQEVENEFGSALSGLQVQFLTSEEYSKITAKDSKTVYFVDGNEMYLGDVKLSADKTFNSNGGIPVSIKSGQVNIFERINN